MTVDEIRELIKLTTDTGIDELEVQRGDNRVRIRRSVPASRGLCTRNLSRHAPAASADAAPRPRAPAAKEAPKEPGADPNLFLVRIAHRRHILRILRARIAAVCARGRARAARQDPVHHRIHEADERDRGRSFRDRRKQAGDERTARGVRGGLVCHPLQLRKF